MAQRYNVQSYKTTVIAFFIAHNIIFNYNYMMWYVMNTPFLHIFAYKLKNMELLIKDIAKEKGITLNEIAEKVGITQPSISRIVNGRMNPTLDTLEKIADSLGVGITELFKREDKGLICPHCGNNIKVDIQKM